MGKRCKSLLTLLLVSVLLSLAAPISASADNATGPDPNFHIYLCFGQSNMEGLGTIESRDRTGVDPRFQMLCSASNYINRTFGTWYTAVPPLAHAGAYLGVTDYFGRTMVERLPEEYRVGVIVVAVGGTKIELFDQDKNQAYIPTLSLARRNLIINSYSGDPYAHLVDLARQAQEVGVIKGVLLHQGESNGAGDSAWPSKVNKVYNDLLNDLGLTAADVPLLAGEVLQTEERGNAGAMNGIIDTLPQTIPTAHVISSVGLPNKGDNWHFTSQGYRDFGARYAAQMLQLLKLDTRIDLAAEQITLNAGESGRIQASLVPSEAGSLRYTSSDPTVVSVDASGNLQAHAAGSASITASYPGGVVDGLTYLPAESVTVSVTVQSAGSGGGGSQGGDSGDPTNPVVPTDPPDPQPSKPPVPTAGSITVKGTIPGMAYDLYRILDLTPTDDAIGSVTDAWTGFFTGSEYLLDTQASGEELQKVKLGDASKYLNVTESNVAQFAAAAEAWAAGKDADTYATAEGAQLSITGLPFGYYLLIPRDVPNPNVMVASSLCGIDATNPDATINAKTNYSGSFSKSFADGSKAKNVELGERVSFVLRGVVPDSTGVDSPIYTITDTMTDGLTFSPEIANLKLSIGGTEITLDDNNRSWADKGFELNLDMAQYQDKRGEAIVVSFDAIVNEQAVPTASNTAVMQFNNETLRDMVTLYTSQLSIKKVNAEDEPLPGAEFRLINAHGQYLKLTPSTVASTGKIEWVAESEASPLISGADGLITINGLKDGTYTIKEVKAPTGYAPLTATRDVQISSDAVHLRGATVEEPIVNRPASLLPETGGVGAVAYNTLGLALMLTAAALAARRKRGVHRA